MPSQNTHRLARLALFLALTLAVQFTGLPQALMGPLVNAVLLLAAFMLGPTPAVLLGMLTPAVALIRGHLPPFLAVLVPFIAAANGMFILAFAWVIRIAPDRSGRTFSVWKIAAVVLAAALKTGFLFLSVRVLIPLALGFAVPPNIAFIMTAPQFATATAGGLIALFLIRIFVRRDVH